MLVYGSGMVPSLFSTVIVVAGKVKRKHCRPKWFWQTLSVSRILQVLLLRTSSHLTTFIISSGVSAGVDSSMASWTSENMILLNMLARRPRDLLCREAGEKAWGPSSGLSALFQATPAWGVLADQHPDSRASNTVTTRNCRRQPLTIIIEFLIIIKLIN